MNKLSNILKKGDAITSLIRKKENGYILVTVLFFCVGFVMHIIPAFREGAISITEGFLFLINIFVFGVCLIRFFSYRLLMISFLILLFTFLIEVIGIKTGKIFGYYHYGNVFSITLFDVPLVIGFNWLMLIMSANSLVRHWVKREYLILFCVAILVMVFDLLLEPVSIKLGYWTWENNAIPVQNYLAWFFIAFFFSFPLRYFTLDSRLLQSYIIIQFLYFAGLSLLL